MIFSFLTRTEWCSLYETCKEFKNIFNNMFRKRIRPTIKDLVSSHSIRFIEWAKTHKTFEYSRNTLQFATQKNDIEIVKYLYRDGCKFNQHCILEAIVNENLQMIKWLKKKGCLLTHTDFNKALEVGNLKIIKWLEDNDCDLEYVCGNYSALSGNVKVVEHVLYKNYYIDVYIYCNACIKGDLKMIKYLVENLIRDLSKPWMSGMVCAKAAEYGHLNILKFVREKKCEWNYMTTSYAAMNNHINILKWALDNGCEITEKVYNELHKYNLRYERSKLKIINENFV